MSVVDRLNEIRSQTYVCSHSHEVHTHHDDEDVDNEPNPSSQTPLLVESRTQIRPSHSKVGDAPKNPAKERIEKSTHKRQQIGEEGDDFGDDEGKHPGEGENTCPRCPADNGVIRFVPRAFEDAEEDESGTNRGVENPEEDQSRDHEREGYFLIHLVAKRAESRGGVVLSTGIPIDETADQRKDNDFGNGNDPQCLAKVEGILHLRDERWKCDLTNEGVANIEKGVHTRNKSSSSCRNDKHKWLSTIYGCAHGVFVGRYWTVAGSAMLAFGSCERRGQNDADKGEEGRNGCKLRERIESARQRADKGRNRTNSGKYDGTDRMVSHGVEIA